MPPSFCNASLALRIDHACDRFEQAWRASGPKDQGPRLEDFLAGPGFGPGEVEPLFRELLQVEVECRGGAGRPVNAADYRARFSQFEAVLEEVIGAKGKGAETPLPARSGGWKPDPDLVSPAIQTGHRASPGDDRFPCVAGYEILGELGRGGMGVVYKARQVKADRLVALKMILAGAHAGEADLARFRTEVESVARLQHPHIVQVFEVGEHGGLPFFSLELCRAGSLDRKLAGNPLPPGEAARLVHTLALAVHAAHTANVLHRDLKPANVLLSPDIGSGFAVPSPSPPLLTGLIPKITDFGLAKKLDEQEPRQAPTETGVIVGTPSYMAPEQAEGKKEVGPPADVYALGAILYECLTGRPPFKASTSLDTILQVLTDDPVPPRRLQPRVPLDLETICLNCLRKEASKRYGTAKGLADDLQRFLDGRSIEARPMGPAERAWRWTRRSPALASLYAVSLLAALALLAVGFWATARITKAKTEQQASEKLAASDRYHLLVGQARERSGAGWTWAALEDLHQAAALPAARKNLASLRTEVARVAGETDLRRKAVLGTGFPASCCAYSPDGKQLAVAQAKVSAWTTGSVKLVDPGTGKTIRSLSYTPSLPWQFKKRVPDGLLCLAFSPDGRWLAAGARSGMVHAWDLTQAGVPAKVRQGHNDEVVQVVFAPDGAALFSCGGNKVTRWSVPDWKVTRSREIGRVGALASDPLGRWLACSGGEVTKLVTPDLLHDTHFNWKQSGPLAATPDGLALAIGTGNRVVIHSVEAPEVVLTFRHPQAENGHVSRILFSPDGSLLLTVSEDDRRVSLWEAGGGGFIADAVVPAQILCAAFAPDGRSFAVTAEKETWVFEVGGLHENTFALLSPTAVHGFTCRPGSRFLAALARTPGPFGTSLVGLWPLADPPSRPEATLTLPHSGVGKTVAPALAFHREGGDLIISAMKKVAVWTPGGFGGPPGGGPLRYFEDREDVDAMACDPSDRRWLIGGARLRTWGTNPDAPGPVWSDDLGAAVRGYGGGSCLAVGARGAATGWRDGTFRLHRPADAAVIASSSVSTHGVSAVAMNADETRAVCGTETGGLVLVRLPSGVPVEWEGAPAHTDRVNALAFHPDGLLASGGRDRVIKLWRGADTPELLLSLRTPRPVRSLAFVPQSARLAYLLEGERAVRLWHLDRLGNRLARLGIEGELPPAEGSGLPCFTANGARKPVVYQAPASDNGFRVELFGDPWFQDLRRVRYDAGIRWNWGGAPPAPDIPANNYSIRWSGFFHPRQSGRHRFALDTQGRAMLYLNGEPFLPNRGTPGNEVTVHLEDKLYHLRVDLTRTGDYSSIDLQWAREGGTLQPFPPGIIYHEPGATVRNRMSKR